MSEWAGVEGLMNIRKSMIQSTLLDVVAMFRRGEKKYRLAINVAGLLAPLTLAILALGCGQESTPARRPNILLAISDDQSYPHASAYGATFVSTPAFDRIAREGVLFRNAFAASPGCSPSRAALLTGRHDWQLEQAGTHASSFPAKYVTYPDLLEQSGYFVGFTGKGWGPGNWQDFRPRNPAGPEFSDRETEPPYSGISKTDYAANFKEFLEQKPANQPFCFWYGAHEPHREYEKGAGLKAGKRLEDVVVPPFLPDTEEIRSDILDYAIEVEWFDQHLARMIEMLERAGELDNTLIIATSDNGMPFPRAKANAYEYGIHMPLAIRWGARVPGSRVVDDLVGWVDLTATILEAAGVKHPAEFPPAGSSILDTLESRQQGLVDASRTQVFSARERHSSSRYENWTYPQRALRTPQYLYIRNFKPDRWPAGDPQDLAEDGTLGPMHGGYHDIDASPSLAFLVEKRDDPEISRFFHLAVDKRPAEELFDIQKDPGCLHNLAAQAEYEEVRARLSAQLEKYLTETEDPRMLGNGDIWETYKRYSPIRKFPPPQ
jgi:N-sulfoglucosamine sulfohydrolase